MITMIWALIIGALALLVRPGVNLFEQDSEPATVPPSDTSQTFAVVLTDRGQTGAIITAKSWDDCQKKIGIRTSFSARSWDALELFFRRGGQAIKLARYVGPAAVKATANLDGTAAGAPFSLTATALGEGEWYNGLRLTITDSSGLRQLAVTHNTDTTINEVSGFKSTQQELVDWAKTSAYIRLAIGGEATLPVVVANVAMTGGLGDYGNAVTAQKLAALTLFDHDQGPGQVAIVGATSATEWAGLGTHCSDFERDGVVAFADTSVEATLIAAAEDPTVRAVGRFLMGVAGWLEVPNTVGTGTKFVSPELAVCAKMAAHDRNTGGMGQNKPVAGMKRGQIERILSVSQGQSATWKDPAARTRLNDQGVNLIREMFGGVFIYGYRSLADPDTDKNWTNFGNRRLHMAIKAKARAALEPMVFEEIDPEGTLYGDIQGTIIGTVVDPYFQVGSLYGASAEQAYRVKVKEVNTQDDVIAKRVNVAINVIESEFAEEIDVFLTKSLISEGVES